MEEKQKNWTIGESYELPSGGIIYDKKINPRIELRSMTARDELKRANPNTLTPLKSMADIIEGCMIEKPAIHVYDMCLGDYEYLLHKLRVISYGDEYKITVGCPYCGETFEQTIHLENLELKEFDQDKFNELQTFTLPDSGRLVSIAFQTPHMMDDLKIKAKELKRKYKNADLDFETMAKLQAIIETVDGNPLTAFETDTFIDRLSAKDMLKILQNSDKLNTCIGLNTELHLECPTCESDVLSFFRIGPEFFRPEIK